MTQEEKAAAKGYTRHVILSGEGAVFEAMIEPDADQDGAFTCFDIDNQEWIVVSGWLIDSIEDVAA